MEKIVDAINKLQRHNIWADSFKSNYIHLSNVVKICITDENMSDICEEMLMDRIQMLICSKEELITILKDLIEYIELLDSELQDCMNQSMEEE